LFKGVDINERGEIAGFGGLPNGDVHAFLLIPCDEDHAQNEGCEQDATITTAATRRPMSPNQSIPGFPRAVNLMLRPFGRRLMPWYRCLPVQPPK
jgi:hypothetical protein